jgi:rhomboid family GlyGly-CTERM serine protease
MGLHNVSEPGSPGRFAEILRQAHHWRVPVAIAILAVVIAAFGAAGAELLKYDRLAIGDGEYWRLLSGHFAHLGPEHLLLNLAGLVLVWLLVGRQYTTPQWLIVTAFSLVIISLGFWFLDRNLIWYVGLSGLLHGLLIAGAMGHCPVRKRPRVVQSLPTPICTVHSAVLSWRSCYGVESNPLHLYNAGALADTATHGEMF